MANPSQIRAVKSFFKGDFSILGLELTITAALQQIRERALFGGRPLGLPDLPFGKLVELRAISPCYRPVYQVKQIGQCGCRTQPPRRLTRSMMFFLFQPDEKIADIAVMFAQHISHNDRAN